MTSPRQPDAYAYRAAAELAAEANSAEQARRRAARWYAWLKSPECTFQDRENFERWCRDEQNAAAYVALCGDVAALPELATHPVETSVEYAARVFASAANLRRFEAETR